MEKLLYADYNATTPLCPEARDNMLKAFEVWGNPSSAHRVGREATALLEEARARVAAAAGVEPGEVVFTSGGAEANTTALTGSRFLGTDFRLVTSGLEHSSVKGCVEFLKQTGAQVRLVPARRDGSLDLGALETLLTEFRPHLVSLMTANNETGVLFPIPEIAGLCRKADVVFHTDAVQAFGKVPASHFNGADLISLSGHKIGGPKGIGALIVRRGRKLVPTNYGGSQELKRRGGTQNMVGAAGFGGACTGLPSASRLENLARARDRFEASLGGALEGVHVQGGTLPRIPNTSNVRVEGIAGNVLLSALDLDGVCVSAGSACSSGSITPSHVLTEMGLEEEAARECLRFSFSPFMDTADIDTVAGVVIQHVRRIRARRKGN